MSKPSRELRWTGRTDQMPLLLAVLFVVALLPLRSRVISPRTAQIELDVERMDHLRAFSAPIPGPGDASLGPEGTVFPSQEGVARGETASTGGLARTRLEELEIGMVHVDSTTTKVIPGFLSLADQIGLENVRVLPPRRVVSDGPYARQTFPISMEGEYSGITMFLKAVSNTSKTVVPRVMAITRVKHRSSTHLPADQMISDGDSLLVATAGGPSRDASSSPQPSMLSISLEVDVYGLVAGTVPVRAQHTGPEASAPTATAHHVPPVGNGKDPFLPDGLSRTPVLAGMRLTGVIASLDTGHGVAVFTRPGPRGAVGSTAPEIHLLSVGEYLDNVRVVAISTDSVVVEIEGLGAISRRTILLEGNRTILSQRKLSGET